MPTEPAKKQPGKLESVEDETLKRVIDIIVNDFHGDTSAYYESIRKNAPLKDHKAEYSEACLAQKFVKSV